MKILLITILLAFIGSCESVQHVTEQDDSQYFSYTTDKNCIPIHKKEKEFADNVFCLENNILVKRPLSYADKKHCSTGMMGLVACKLNGTLMYREF